MDGSEPYQQALKRYADFDQRGGWARLVIYASFGVFVLLGICVVWLISDARDSYYAGAAAVFLAMALGCAMLGVAGLSYVIVSRKGESLSTFHRVLGVAPTFTWLAGFVWFLLQ